MSFAGSQLELSACRARRAVLPQAPPWRSPAVGLSSAWRVILPSAESCRAATGPAGAEVTDRGSRAACGDPSVMHPGDAETTRCRPREPIHRSCTTTRKVQDRARRPAGRGAPASPHPPRISRITAPIGARGRDRTAATPPPGSPAPAHRGQAAGSVASISTLTESETFTRA